MSYLSKLFDPKMVMASGGVGGIADERERERRRRRRRQPGAGSSEFARRPGAPDNRRVGAGRDVEAVEVLRRFVLVRRRDRPDRRRHPTFDIEDLAVVVE